MGDVELLRRVARGDEEALISLYRSYGNLVYSVAMRILNEQTDAEEVTQDVFMTIWKKAATYESEKGAFSTWVGVISRRKAIDVLRHKHNNPLLGWSLDDNVESSLIVANGENNDYQHRDIDLTLAVKNLPSEQQECISLIYFGGMTHHELAEHLKIPLGTVKSRVRLAMDKLREAMITQPELKRAGGSANILNTLNSVLFGIAIA
jgi:RNA polymerase sigma-70 factor (ECF subfamily)